MHAVVAVAAMQQVGTVEADEDVPRALDVLRAWKGESEGERATGAGENQAVSGVFLLRKSCYARCMCERRW